MTYARIRTWPQVNQLMGTWQWRQNEWQSNRRFPSPTSTGELKYTFTQIRHSPLAKLRTTISWLRICRFVQLFSLSISRAWLRSAICEGWKSRWMGEGRGWWQEKAWKKCTNTRGQEKTGLSIFDWPQFCTQPRCWKTDRPWTLNFLQNQGWQNLSFVPHPLFKTTRQMT